MTVPSYAFLGSRAGRSSPEDALVTAPRTLAGYDTFRRPPTGCDSMSSDALTPAQQEQLDNRDSLGQFKDKQHHDVEDTTEVLGLTESALPAGTFYHPPHLDTAEETLAFFRHVEVDDATIERFQDATESSALEQYGNVLRERVEAASVRWQEENPAPKKENTILGERYSDWQERKREFEDAEMERLRSGELDSFHAAGVAPVVNDADAQVVVRAMQIGRNMPIDPHEQQKLREHTVHLRRTQPTGETTLKELWNRYGNDHVTRAIDSTNADASGGDDVQRQMLEELRKFNQNAEIMRQHQDKIRHNTGTLLDNYNMDREADEIARGWRDHNGKPIGPGRSIARRVLGG